MGRREEDCRLRKEWGYSMWQSPFLDLPLLKGVQENDRPLSRNAVSDYC